MLRPTSFMPRSNDFPRLEVEELSVSKAETAPVYLSSQATRKYHGNIRELIGDLKKFRDSGENDSFC